MGLLDTHVLLMVVIRVEEDSHAVEDLDVAERRPEFVVLLGVPQREAVAEERLALAVDIELDGQLKGRALERLRGGAKRGAGVRCGWARRTFW